MSLLLAQRQSLVAQSHGIPRVARLVLAVLLACVGYYGGGLIGLSVRFPPSGISIIWPPNAILIAALLLSPPRIWGWYLLAALPTHLHLVTNFQPGASLQVMLTQFAGNAIQAVIAALAVRRWAAARGGYRFDSLRGVTIFIVLAGVIVPAAVSALVAYAFGLQGWVSDSWLAWRRRFLTNVVPTITLTPLIVLTVDGGVGRIRRMPSWRYAEFGLLAAVLFAVGLPVFGWWQPDPGILPALLYAPLPLLLWAAVRFGAAGTCLSLVVISFLSLSNAFAGRGPFSILTAEENVVSLQVFLTAIAIPLILLAALVEEQRRTEESLRRVQADLTHAARVMSMGQLVATIAHEINQPLTAIVMNARASLRRIASDSPGIPELREVFQDIADDGKRASAVIQHIRDLLKNKPMQTGPLGLNAVLREVITLVLGELRSHHISLRTELADDLPPVLGDRVQLQQVVLNLLMNSIEAMSAVDDRSRELIIQSCRADAGSIVVAVCDSGPGLDPGDPDAIFTAFYTTKANGMGMGLSVSRSIVEAHGGRLWATTQETGGAKLQFSLPTA